MEQELLRIENLRKYFSTKGSGVPVKAVDDVSLSIARGETLGLVGESGSGKTTLGRVILRLVEPDGGRILFDGADITHANMQPYRRRMQIVFQNPAGSLDPRSRVREVVAEGVMAGGFKGTKAQVTDQVAALLHRVGLQPDDMYRFPGEFSGGQQQRIGIARALAVKPEFLICDEPVSALDVSLQSQIVNLLEDLKAELKMTYLFISHDLSVVMHISDRVCVMYRGRVVELGSREDIVRNASHPYTRTLLNAIPIPDPVKSRQRERSPLYSEPLILGKPLTGCRFAPRCAYATDACYRTEPALVTLSPGHSCACHRMGSL